MHCSIQNKEEDLTFEEKRKLAKLMQSQEKRQKTAHFGDGFDDCNGLESDMDESFGDENDEERERTLTTNLRVILPSVEIEIIQHIEIPHIRYSYVSGIIIRTHDKRHDSAVCS